MAMNDRADLDASILRTAQILLRFICRRPGRVVTRSELLRLFEQILGRVMSETAVGSFLYGRCPVKESGPDPVTASKLTPPHRDGGLPGSSWLPRLHDLPWERSLERCAELEELTRTGPSLRLLADDFDLYTEQRFEEIELEVAAERGELEE